MVGMGGGPGLCLGHINLEVPMRNHGREFEDLVG